MRVIQVLGNLAYGDAIGNHAVALKGALQRGGYSTEIYAESVDQRFPAGTARHLSKLRHLKKSDILIYHLSFGTPLNLRLKSWRCRKIIMYHNITPPSFYEPYDKKFADALREGLRQTAQLVNDVERCIAVSEFNKQDLMAMGYPADRIWVMPGCLIPFSDYKKSPDPATVNRYSDGWVNLLFVGRIAPNKKQEDIVRTFAYYKKHINPQSRLILVGSEVVPEYVEELRDYIKMLGLSDVIFPGHISFAQLIAFYRSASVFVCMSEHEGFCVPLVEAMYFDIPVLAYCAAAVPDTLGGCGVLLDKKDAVETALWIDRILSDSNLRISILNGQRQRLKKFQPQRLEDIFLQYLSEVSKKERE